MIEEDDWKLAVTRIEAMPANLKLSLGNQGSLTKVELMEHITKRDKIGETIVKAQLNYLKYFKKELEKDGK